MVIRATGVAAGGDAISHLDDGRIVFVGGLIPGEVASIDLVEMRRDYARGRIVEILEPGTDRVDPPCPHRHEGCGGCPWQHVSGPAQLTMKAAVVADALLRIGRKTLDGPLPAPGAGPAWGYRTTVRLGVVADGRLAYRRQHGHELVAVTDCMVAHPRLSDAIATCRFPGAGEVTLRASAATGERMAVVAGLEGAGAAPAGLEGAGAAPAHSSRGRGRGQGRRRHPRRANSTADTERWTVPDDLIVVDLRAPSGPMPYLSEDVAGRPWRVSATSFFQPGPQGAELLVAAVTRALGGCLGSHSKLVDAYCGVGMLGGAVASVVGCELLAIEGSESSVADARHNLADLSASVIHADVRALGSPVTGRDADAVIADPPRSGLDRAGCAAVVALGAPVLVLVSCDPAAFGRDARLLSSAGYELQSYEVLDLFPQTFQTEIVSRFERGVATKH